MADVSLLENRLPVAPLKLLALDSAKENGAIINDYLVSFRKQTHLNFKGDPAFQKAIHSRRDRLTQYPRRRERRAGT